MTVTDWTYSDAAVAVDPAFGEVHDDAWRRLGEVGTWWTGEERVAILAECRAVEASPLWAAAKEALSPTEVFDGQALSALGRVLPAAAVEAAHRISADPARLTRTWVASICDVLGEEAYVELAAIVATRHAIDGFASALGAQLRPLPLAGTGEPTRVRPEGVGDVGAFVSQSTDKTLANVSRAASLVPDTADIWRGVVDQQYSRGPEFAQLVWDRPLSRPQVEVVAATVSSLNECFY